MVRSGRTWWGIALIVVGALLFLDTYLELDFGGIIRTWWPLLLIIWGGILILRHSSAQHAGDDTPSQGIPSPGVSQGSASPDEIIQSSVFGDTTVQVSSQSFRGGTVSTVFGDTTIDLSSAGLSDGEHLLRVNGVFGDTTITLPKDMAFSTTVHTVMGDVQVIDLKKEGFGSSLSYEVPEYTSAPKKLRIHTSLVFGDIKVRR